MEPWEPLLVTVVVDGGWKVADRAGRLLEQWTARGRAEPEEEVVAAATRALLGVARRLEGTELRLLVDPERGVTVRVSQKRGRPVAELDTSHRGSRSRRVRS